MGDPEKVPYPAGDRLWIRLRPFPSAAEAVPMLPGVYAIGQVRSFKGLPVSVEWVYIGESKNLRNRLANHEALTESNHALRSWLRVTAEIEVWYSVDKHHRKAFEKELVRQIQPKFNLIKFKT